MAIDPKLVSIKTAGELPVSDPSENANFLFYEGDTLQRSPMSNIYDKVSSGLLPATTATVPEATGFHRYLVHEAGTYTNFKDSGNAAVVVTSADLDVDVVSGVANNEVILEVYNGVATKRVRRVKGDVGPEADVSDLIIKAGQNVAAILGTDSESAPNVTDDLFIINDGSGLPSANYFTSDYIKIEFPSVKYSTKFGSLLPAVCIYDANKTFIAGKNATEMVNTDAEYTERLLDDDFDLTNAVYVRISCANTESLIVKYDENIIRNHTISELDFDSDKPINSNAVKFFNTEIDMLREKLSDVNRQLDEAFDDKAPLFLDIGNFLKTYGGISSPSGTTTYTATRVNDYDISGSFAAFDAPLMGITILSGGRHYFHNVKKINDNLLRSVEVLPATFTQFQMTLGDAQHLSRFGTKGLGEYVADSIPRKRKVKVLSALSQNCQAYEKDWIQNGQTIISITRLAGTATGGLAADGIIAGCEMYANSSALRTGNIFKNEYYIAQNTANTGINFKIPVGEFKGFLKINLGEQQTNLTSVNVVVKDQNGTDLHNSTFRSVNKYVTVDFSTEVSELDITIKSSVNGLFVWSVNSIEVFKDYNDYSQVFKANHSAMWVMDSWGVFPEKIGAEVGFINPLGVTMPGLGWTPLRYKEYLESQGFTVKNSNYSRGGMTVKWADFWVNRFLDNETETPDYVFLDFAINDSNSREYLSQTNTSYDFSPTEPYEPMAQSDGGIKGAITLEQHIKHYKSLIKKITSRGATPVLLVNGLIGQNFAMIDTLVAQLNADLK